MDAFLQDLRRKAMRRLARRSECRQMKLQLLNDERVHLCRIETAANMHVLEQMILQRQKQLILMLLDLQVVLQKSYHCSTLFLNRLLT